MKKKLIATIVAGAVLSAGLIGLTACDTVEGLTINKGEQVTKEQWVAAITQSLAAESYTVDVSNVGFRREKGSTEELGKFDTTRKYVITGNVYYDGSTYSKTVEAVKFTGVPDAYKDNANYQDAVINYEEYICKEITTYNVNYYTTHYSSDYGEWYTGPGEGNINYTLAQSLGYNWRTEKTGQAVKITQLYDAFTYSGGVYTATLYNSGSDEYKVSVSIKGGYVVGYSEYNYDEYSNEKGTAIYEGTEVSNYSNYGSTTVNASDAAKQAIETYKSNH